MVGIVKDLYPSRYSHEVEITPRKDPVIHTREDKESQTELSKEQINHYKKNGFVFLDHFFSETEVEQLNNEMDNVRNACRNNDAPEIIRDPNGDDIRSVYDVHNSNNYLEKLASNERLLDITNYLLGGDVYVHQSRFNYEPGFTEKELSWHSDFETWHVEDGMPRMRAVCVSIALSDNHTYNGPLMLIPGSHNYFISCLGDAADHQHKKSLSDQEYGVPDKESMTWLANMNGISVPTGPAGSVLLFDCNTMHGSNGNITPFDRNNLFMVYNSVENRLTEPFGNKEPRPEYVAAREKELVLS